MTENIFEYDFNNPSSFEFILYNNLKNAGLSHEEILRSVNDLNKTQDTDILDATKRLGLIVDEIRRNS